MTVDVALKVIPKKKVKGNESSVWSEMEVLKGLSHPNVVSPRRYPYFLICAALSRRLAWRPSMQRACVQRPSDTV